MDESHPSLVTRDQLKEEAYHQGYDGQLVSNLSDFSNLDDSSIRSTALVTHSHRPEDLIVHSSKGYTIDYNINAPTPTSLKKPLRVTTKITPSLRDLLNIVLQDPTAMAAIDAIVNKVMENGWYVRGRDQKSKDKSAMETLAKLRFNELLREILVNLVMYNNAFVEIIKEGNTVSELHKLETTLMRISMTNFGDIIGYWQNVILPDRKGNPGFSMEGYPVWEPDEVVHFKKNRYTTRGWGDVELEALASNIKTKLAIKRFVYWLFETNQFRGFFKFGNNTSDDQIKEFLTYYKLMNGDLTKPLTARGEEIEFQILRDFKDAPSMLSWIEKMDNETLELLHVPPMMLGRDTGGANRSTGDTALAAFHQSINGLQEYIQDKVSNELLPLLGFPKVDFVFGPVDDADVEKLMNVAQVMTSMNMKPEVIEAWLRQEGFQPNGFDSGYFLSPDEMAANAMKMTAATKPNDLMTQDQSPSRKGKSPGAANQRVGTGSNSTTRKEQLVAHAEAPRWYYDFIVPE